jgi:Flp pilus assembly protein TadB
MSEEILQDKKRPFADFSLGQLVATVLAAIAVSIIAAALSVWVSQATTLQRLSAVEEAQKNAVTRENLDERWKTVERIDRNVEKLRDLFLPQKRDDTR